MAELIDKKLVLKDIASWVVGGNPEEPQMVSIDEFAMAMGVSIGRLPTTTESEIRAKVLSELVEQCNEEKYGYMDDRDEWQLGVLHGLTVAMQRAEQLKERE